MTTDCALVEADYKVPDGGAVSAASTTFTVGTDTSKTVTLITMDQNSCEYAETITISPDLSTLAWISRDLYTVTIASTSRDTASVE